MIPTHATEFDGDPAECVKWLGYARGVLQQMIRDNNPAVKSKHLFLNDDTEIWITKNPNAIRIKSGSDRAYCTHRLPPRDETNRAIYHNKTTPFNPDNSQKQAARWWNIRSDNRFPANNYWQDKTDKYTLSFDDIAVYLDGKMLINNVLSQANPDQQSNNLSWLITACHPKQPLSETDYNTYKAIDASLTPDLIGCNRVVCLIWNQQINKNQLIVFCYTDSDYKRVYIRNIDAGYNVVYYPNFAGFKTDCKSLIINTKEQVYLDPDMGLYRLEFNNDYTDHNSIKIADSNYNQAHVIQTYSNTTNVDGVNGAINATQTQNSVNQGGFVVVDVFQSKDDFTVIVLNISAWEFNYTYSKVVDASGNWTRIINRERNEKWKYSAYKLKNDTLIHHRDLYIDSVEETGTANDSFNAASGVLTINQVFTQPDFGIYSKMLFANWRSDTYLWMKEFINGTATVNMSDEPNYMFGSPLYVFYKTVTDSENYYKLQLLKNNELTTLDERLYSDNGTYDLLESELPVRAWNFGNTNGIEEQGYTYYLLQFCSVYDDKYLMLGCYNLDWRISGSDIYYPKTIKMNIKTGDYVIQEGRLDLIDDKYYPLSVTLDKKTN